MKTTKYHRFLAPAILALYAAGCASWFSSKVEAPPVVRPTAFMHPKVTEGSLWSGNDSFTLFADAKACGAGDLVTVKILEDSKAARSSKTDMTRASDIDAGVSNFFGLESYLKGGSNALSPTSQKGGLQNVDPAHMIKSNSTASFKADASMALAGSVVANVTAQVIEQRPDGNLRIFGSSVITINNDDQVVTVSGLIRPVDIADDNTILSSQIADARVLYSGRGPVTMSTRPGWGFRLFYGLWPF
ncbi:MAG: flagellar basal body L-ring protein FlgH [Candidatus Sumerlaeota bacterium]|nr:flagellar basal body L-ring protein FlgH [Candidatus Sumerlaeota bacterium]